MRHIPEDELHAYLDQGLSRTQCVEIESHLADCPSCQAMRDGIAALRDRTTALLSRLAPPRNVPPAFEVLRRRAAVVASQRRRRLSIVAWAASLVAAVGLGWTASSFLRSPDAAPPTIPVAARESTTAERMVASTSLAPAARLTAARPTGSAESASPAAAHLRLRTSRPGGTQPSARTAAAAASADSAAAASRTAAALRRRFGRAPAQHLEGRRHVARGREPGEQRRGPIPERGNAVAHGLAGRAVGEMTLDLDALRPAQPLVEVGVELVLRNVPHRSPF